MRVAFPTDEHHPYADNRARKVALKIVQDFNPDLLIAGSDALDFYNLSVFDKNPQRVTEMNLQVEINEWKLSQKEWNSAAPNARKKFLIGNHEDRLRRSLWKFQQFYWLEALKLKNLLGFEELGIDGEEVDEILIHNTLAISHGKYIRKHSGYTAKAELEKEMFSVCTMTGHTHRGGSHYAKTRFGIVHAHECFCLCDLDAEYIKNPNWQQGICLAYVEKGFASVIPIPIYTIYNHKVAYWNDKVYKA